MPAIPLPADSRIQKLIERGYTVVSHIKQEDAEKADQTGADPLGIYVKDGFYRIVQIKDDNTVSDATLTARAGEVGQQEFPVKMDVTPQLQARIWRLTRQYGIKNTFTIVPLDTPTGGVQDPQLGGTTAIKNDTVIVKRSSCYPIWKIDCVETVIYRDTDGTYHQIHYFRIIEVGTNRCWKTDDNTDVVIANILSGRPPANQLFELIEAVGRATVIFSSQIANITVTATNANIVKKYYFGTSQINPDNLLRWESVQLETDARDQGWASNPNQGLWSWFEIAIFTKVPEQGAIVKPEDIKQYNGRPLTWTSHELPLTREYQEQQGPVFERDHELWRHISQGDYIGVLACAQFPLWKADARRGTLTIQEMIINPVK